MSKLKTVLFIFIAPLAVFITYKLVVKSPAMEQAYIKQLQARASESDIVIKNLHTRLKSLEQNLMSKTDQLHILEKKLNSISESAKHNPSEKTQISPVETELKNEDGSSSQQVAEPQAERNQEYYETSFDEVLISQGYDEHWAQSAESNISESIGTFTNEIMDTYVELREVTCQETLCKLSVSMTGNQFDIEKLSDTISKKIPWDNHSFNSLSFDEQGNATFVSYISREGYELPSLEQ